MRVKRVERANQLLINKKKWGGSYWRKCGWNFALMALGQGVEDREKWGNELTGGERRRRETMDLDRWRREGKTCLIDIEHV